MTTDTHEPQHLDTEAGADRQDLPQERIFEILELFDDVRNSAGGGEYKQGKKDGLRLALAILQPGGEWQSLIRGAIANPRHSKETAGR